MELPRTPPRGDVANERINLKEVLLRLDATYNIGLHRYLETSRQLRSSHDADELRRAEDIIRRLRYHVQSREGQIHDVLKDFDVRVGLISSGWVHKPLADRGTTPTRLNPPRALNADERRDLQNALLYVLESRSPKKPASFRLDSGSPVNVNATSFGESFEVESPQRHRSAKRSSGGFEGGPSKRNRPTRSFPATSLDEVPVREKPQPIAAWRESLDRAETPRDSEITSTAACDSRNTSKASLISRVFETPPLAPSDSQTTYAVSSQETTEAIPKIFAHRPAFGRANGQSLAPPAEALHLEPSEHVKLKWREYSKTTQPVRYE